MYQLFGFGKDGKLLSLDTRESPVVQNRLAASTSPTFAEIPMKDGFHPDKLTWLESQYLHTLLPDLVAEEYSRRYGADRYGPFGDVISVLVINEFQNLYPGLTPVIVNYIAPQSFAKPGIAADLVVFVRNDLGQRYFVGIRRTNEPGIGAPATIGGFLDVRGNEFVSPLQTILHEGSDEAGIHLASLDGSHITEDELLSTKRHYVLVTLPSGEKFAATLKYIGVEVTSNTETLPSGYKRVYWAFGYVLEVDLGSLATDVATISKLFNGSDEGAIFVQKLENPDDCPDFHSSQHRTLFRRGLRIALGFSYPAHT